MGLVSTTRRVADIATSVKRQFGDESGVQLTDSDIIRWCDDAQRQIAAKLKIIKARAVVQAIPGQGTYNNIPVQNSQQIESVRYDGKPVRGTTMAQAEETIYERDPQNQIKGNPSIWYTHGADMFFWPVPDSAKDITIYYTGIPLPLVALSDLFSIPDSHYDTIHAYVMAKAYELDEEFDASNNQRNMFATDLGDQDSEDAEGQQLTYPLITVVDDDL